MLTKRFCLSFGLALVVAGGLVAQRSGPAPELEGPGIVYVYYPSLCVTPGDSSDCKEISRGARPSFLTMADCMAHADIALREEHNPRVMASCLKEREG
jgi:hypothetical protein